jgi:NAD(P)-dependent dehydrogenase (short-subunit alcohol dehydrogenase family)
MEASQLFNMKGLVALITGGGSGEQKLQTSRDSCQNVDCLNFRSWVDYGESSRSKRSSQSFHRWPKFRQVGKGSCGRSARKHHSSPVQCDVTSKDDLLQIAATVKKTVGYMNLVVANAGLASQGQFLMGINPQSSIEEVQEYMLSRPWEAYTEQFNVHVTATLYTTIVFLGLLNAGNKKGNLG